MNLNPTLLNQTDISNLTALHHVSISGQIAVMELLLRRGACVNSGNQWKFTPLYLACLKGKEAAARLLIEAGADVNSEDIVSN